MKWPELTDNDRARIVQVARAWINTPYKLCRIEQGAGVDCSGLVAAVFYEATGVCLPKDCDSLFVKAPVCHLDQHKPGDLIFFRKVLPYRNHVRLARHVAILTVSGNCIHASYRRRRVIEEPILAIQRDCKLEVVQEKDLEAMLTWLLRYYLRTKDHQSCDG